jgi:hypothetical protein
MMLHIGKEIEKIFTESGIKMSVFAKKLNTVPRNVYNIFSRESLDTETLYAISIILKFDFFRLYFNPKISLPIIKSKKIFSSDNKRVSITIEVDEEKKKQEILNMLNISI